MVLTLYNSSEPNKKAKKSGMKILGIATFQNVLSDFSKVDTVIENCRIHRSDDVSKTLDDKTIQNSVNYCAIDIDGRTHCYFVRNVIFERGLFTLVLHKDVLMSYPEFVNAECIVERQENVWNGYIPDNSYTAYAYTRSRAIKFPNKVFGNEYNYILNVNGGVN